MARTALTAQTADRDGLAPTFSAANVDGHSFVNNGRRALEVKNTDSSTVDVTILHPDIDGMIQTGQVGTVAATTGHHVFGFMPVHYNQPDGTVYVDFEDVTALTVALIEYPEV